MNSTMWESLTSFVQYLGRKGKCTVEETEKGWYIQWIDRDPAAVARHAPSLPSTSDPQRARCIQIPTAAPRETRNGLAASPPKSPR